MNTQKKSFDCVEMKRAGALRICDETKDMSHEEETEYLRRATDELVAAQQEAKRKTQRS